MNKQINKQNSYSGKIRGNKLIWITVFWAWLESRSREHARQAWFSADKFTWIKRKLYEYIIEKKDVYKIEKLK